ncbi:MAG: LysR family transcriptional regulator [Sneathiella sp.]|nr:LysR family transcriptional regulator [Sneathiella sp.]
MAESNGFAEAARSLSVTPSSLSRAVSSIEEKIGTSLIRRTTRSMSLTVEGAAFLVKAKQIIQQLEDLQDVGREAANPRGVIRVNAAVPFMLHVIIPNLSEFRELYPDIDLYLSMSDSVIDLITARTDVAFRLGELGDSQLLARRMGTSKWRLVASPEYLEKKGWPHTISDLEKMDQVRFTYPQYLNDWQFKAGRLANRPHPAVHAENGEAIRQAVLAGLGVAQFSDFMIEDDIRKGHVISLFEEELV